MASDDPTLGPALHRMGIDEALPAGPAPVAYPVVFNSTAGKLDYFLDRRISYTGGSCHGSHRRTTISVVLTNRATVSDGPRLAPGSEARLPVWRLPATLPRDQPRRLVLSLDEPVVPGAPRVQEQPLTRGLTKEVTLSTCR